MNIWPELIAACWLFFVVYWVLASFSVKRGVSRRPGGRRAPALRLMIAAVAVLMLFAFGRGRVDDREHEAQATAPTASEPIAALGVTLTAVGIGVAMWARINIGQNWGSPMSRKEEPELITSGPYAYVRHPIYSGLILALFGTALAGGVATLSFALGATVFFVLSALVEEKHLRERFPDAYREYMRRTKRLVPFVW